MKRVIFVVFIILLSMIWASTTTYGEIPDHEYEALKALYDATAGSNWHKDDNWFAGESPVNTWYGIKCDNENKNVLEIRLPRNNLKGKLPPQMEALKYLRVLILRDNELTYMPPELANLTHLQSLDLGNNQLGGRIPSWIGQLKNLKILCLDMNEFTGPIPVQLGNLANLAHLNLYRNRLSGSIPGELRHLSNLIILNLRYNKVKGTIPTWIDNLSSLKELDLGYNRLAGSIPGNLGKRPNLTTLKLDKNKLEGAIPLTIMYLKKLKDNKSNFKWNALYTKNVDLKDFLNRKQEGGDWESTQTIAPKAIRATPLSQTSIKIKWERIAYRVDSGGYQVRYSTSKGGPYSRVGPDVGAKTKTEVDVKGLKSRQTYYFVVQSWTSPHDNNQNTVYSGISNEVSAATRGTTIFGSVTTKTGKPIEGVTMTVYNKDGTINEKSTTDEDGHYHLGVDYGWLGKVKPSKKGFAFRPAQREYKSPVREDRGDENYNTWVTTVIKGKVTNPKKDKGIPGVTLFFSDMEESDRGPGKTETNEYGEYEFPVSCGWKGKVTPEKKGYKFSPGNIPYTKPVESAINNQDFVAYEIPKISGYVKNRKGKGIHEVTLTFSNREGTVIDRVSTGTAGEYLKVFADIKTWTGSVKPAKTGYIFYPAKRNYENMTVGAARMMENYKTELDLKFFISITGNYMIPSEKGFKDNYGKGIFEPEIKVGYKFSRAFCVWSGYGFASKSETKFPDENLISPGKLRQQFLSLGLGYNKNVSINFDWKVEVGVSYVKSSEEMSIKEKEEEVFYEKQSEIAIGVRINGAGIFKISNRLFTEIALGYLYSSATINDILIDLGGLRAGIGLGLRF
jgi:hypothetical protein